MSTSTPTASPNFTTTTPLQWNSPLPYVFGGLVFILGLIAVALLILAYSHYKSWRDLSDNISKEDKSTACPDKLTDIEPKIVVVMAGDYYPTYVAKPSAPTCLTQLN
ncbi:unnamed protein product [Dovyalis caffra]|uniref:Uncharacterized protein n=1 Tax=Dovyalis caffra TaxID=77055 RepID=A0AAV1QR37_9ROSI|nr:unnamed protein product [Dovyalis caffra]